MDGVTKLLNTFKIHKAAGPDGIVPRILSEFSEQLAPPLTFIFNKSIESGIVPEDWRQPNVAPIFKKGQKYRSSNYRPVSLTCICCKLLEHIVLRNLIEQLENNKILYDWQHGFRSKRSTETQLVTLIHELGENLDNRKQTDITVLDFSKAFDKMSHQLLTIKLDYYGIRGSTLRWINSFLLDRTQKLISVSYTVNVTSAVPQGSVLGPILFLIYINDLPNSLSSKVRLFADDAIVYRKLQFTKRPK